MAPALLTAIDSTAHVHIIVGSNSLAAARCTRSIEVGARPTLIAAADAVLPDGLQKRIETGQVVWMKKDSVDEDDLRTLGRDDVDGFVDAVFLTRRRTSPCAHQISTLCRRLRVPVNVVDAPHLSTFTLLASHLDGPLQIGITTSGNGCKLASRIRREVVSSLPPHLGTACDRLGTIRRRIWEEDYAAAADVTTTMTPTLLDPDPDEQDLEEDGVGQRSTFNQLVAPEDRDAARHRRMRWFGQICEYWPLSRLAAIDDDDVDRILRQYRRDAAHPDQIAHPNPDPALLGAGPRRGRIVLAGSGPGHPDLLTTATHKAIRNADLILADKLVPEAVLALVPRRATVYIARKFPGNADRAQDELLQMGLDGLRAGQHVLRLKQGDPYLYGRGAEEYAFFRVHGHEPVVIPGITSALSAPLFAGIPPTHRAVADQVLICTGTGRAGAAPDPPDYLPSRTVVFLMALHRLRSLVASLVRRPGPHRPPPHERAEDERNEEAEDSGSGPDPGNQHRTLWPLHTPCAVIERASCADQRVIRTSLEHVCTAVEEEGSRPPGLLVLGHSCRVLSSSSTSLSSSLSSSSTTTTTMEIRTTATIDEGIESGSTRRWVVEEGYNGLDAL